MLNPDVLFGHSASRAKGFRSPTRGRNAARKAKQGGEELMSHWITFFVAGMWYLNQEREQCTELKEWGQGCWSEGKKKKSCGVLMFVKIICVPYPEVGNLYLSTLLCYFPFLLQFNKYLLNLY